MIDFKILNRIGLAVEQHVRFQPRKWEILSTLALAKPRKLEIIRQGSNEYFLQICRDKVLILVIHLTPTISLIKIKI